jgi:hypothetical protein
MKCEEGGWGVGGKENESMMRIAIVFNTFNHDDDVWS